MTDEGLVALLPLPFVVFPIAPAVPAPPEENTVTPVDGAVPAAQTVPGVPEDEFTALPPLPPLFRIVPLFVSVPVPNILYPAVFMNIPELIVQSVR